MEIDSNTPILSDKELALAYAEAELLGYLVYRGEDDDEVGLSDKGTDHAIKQLRAMEPVDRMLNLLINELIHRAAEIEE